MPSSGFHEINGETFDDWKVCRTRVIGNDGFYQVSGNTFRPIIAFESLGENSGAAYKLGEQFAGRYPNESRRAEEIFYFVRDRVRYTPDIDQFKLDEFAQNADELATTINQNGVGYGDCEDSAILLAIMFKGAGYRSSITLVPGHTTALVYLPGYKKAATVFTLDGESGWIWAEATGSNNLLGWVPKQFAGTTVAAYEIAEEEVIHAHNAHTILAAVYELVCMIPTSTCNAYGAPAPIGHVGEAMLLVLLVSWLPWIS